MKAASYLSARRRPGPCSSSARGWERPQWYNSNADLVERYGLSERDTEWDNRWWSPITIGEHLNLRENCGMVDLSGLPDLRAVSGPGAVEYRRDLAVNKVDKPVGSLGLHPVANADGGFHSDLTMMRIGRGRRSHRHRRLRRRSRQVLGAKAPADRRLGHVHGPTSAS